MPIFRIIDGSLTPIKLSGFKREKELQVITEKNLGVIFGLRFVCSEFKVGSYRFDTIGFDEETNSFVIIEFKKDQIFSMMDQGFAYLNCMLEHEPDFVLKYNESFGASSTKKDFDWTQSKILFLSPSFTPYQVEALNFKGLPIELWEVHLYSNDIIYYEKIKSRGPIENINLISKKSKIIEKVSSEIKIYTEDALLEGVEKEIKDAYQLVKNIIYQVNPDVEEKIKKTVTGFYTGGKGLVWVQPSKKGIKIWLKKTKYIDKNGQVIHEGFGGYPEKYFKINEIDPVFIRKLIEKANSLNK
jgi:hypothetical protein